MRRNRESNFITIQMKKNENKIIIEQISKENITFQPILLEHKGLECNMNEKSKNIFLEQLTF